MNRKQMSVQDLFAELGLVEGDELVIEGRGGWEMVVESGDKGADFTHQNPALVDGQFVGYKFFAYTTRGNPYGAGKIDQEPTLGVAFKDCGVNGDGKVVGAIVVDDAGEVIGRFSWSNLVFGKDPKTFSVDADGALVVNGVPQGALAAAFLPDKNRLGGFVGVFTPTKPDTVRMLEMEDLVLAFTHPSAASQ
jgi:hypothetical protein